MALPAAIAWFFLHPPRRYHRKTPKTALGLEYERLRLRADDGVGISAWYVPHPNPHGLVVLCHGYFGNRESMLAYLAFLHAGGYAALLFDFRAHGWSDGRRVTFGVTEPRDLKAVLAWVQARPETSRLPLFLLGESMGAAVSLLVAAQTPRVRAVVADSGFARFDGAVEGRLTLALGETLGKLIAPPTRRVGERILGVGTHRIAPEEAIRQIAPRPVLLIHGEQDRLIYPSHAHRLYAASGGCAQLWIVPEARHVQAVHVADGYGERVVHFLNQALPRADA